MSDYRVDGPGHFSKEVEKWGDAAMWKARPIEREEGKLIEPTVYLMGMNPDPLGTIASVSGIYRGKVQTDPWQVTNEERLFYWNDMRKSRLRAPFEFVNLHFLIEGVSRGFTHQAVRQRTAVFGQESMRFAVKEELADETVMPAYLAALKEDDPRRVVWDQTLKHIQDGYAALIGAGVPAEDARGLMPTNIATRLHYSTDLNSLMAHAGNRLCTQAQFEWRYVWAKIVRAIAEKCVCPKHPRFHESEQYGAIPMFPQDCNGVDTVWMACELTNLFRPICYQTGKCEFMTSFDRVCAIRSRVEGNHKLGRTSDEWDKPWGDESLRGFGDGHYQEASKTGRPVFVGEIHTREWLMDPSAASQR